MLLLLYWRQVENGKNKKMNKKKFVTKTKKSTAKGCPASTFLQRWAIFTGDFLGIDIDILLKKYKTSKITSTSTTIDCMVIFVTFVDVVVPLLLQRFVKWDRPWLCVLGVSCFFFNLNFLIWEVKHCRWAEFVTVCLCTCVHVPLFLCQCYKPEKWCQLLWGYEPF